MRTKTFGQCIRSLSVNRALTRRNGGCRPAQENRPHRIAHRHGRECDEQQAVQQAVTGGLQLLAQAAVKAIFPVSRISMTPSSRAKWTRKPAWRGTSRSSVCLN